MFTLRSRSLVLRGAAVLAALFATLAALGTWGAAPAEATSYRFWAYWLGSDNDWSFSSQGASRRPADGTVDGWRFAVSEASSSTTPPRPAPSFGRICGSTDAVDGSKRVGLVVDFGTTADAPDGETPPAIISTCVVAPADANGYEVLDLAAVQLRTDSGLICGLNGYPATECGAVVADPTSSPSDDPSGNGDGGGGSGSSPGSTGSGGGSSGDGGEPTNPMVPAPPARPQATVAKATMQPAPSPSAPMTSQSRTARRTQVTRPPRKRRSLPAPPPRLWAQPGPDLRSAWSSE